MNKYKDIFFDLDNTLWDFDANNRDAFDELVKIFDLQQIVHSGKNFLETYNIHNLRLWKDYREKKIEKEKLRWYRFYITLSEFGVENENLSKEIGEKYLSVVQMMKNLIPGTIEILDYLVKKYSLHIITNGFEEVQMTKLENCKLKKYFKTVITSEKAGYHKPAREIFDFALKQSKAKKSKSLMIGDDYEIDIEGAMNSGIDQVFITNNPIENVAKPSYKIASLIELQSIL